MNASNTLRTDLLKLLFQNVALPGIGDASGLQPSATAGNVYVRLCTDAVPVNSETLGIECAYTGYAAKGIGVARTIGGWSVVANVVKNIEQILFGACTAGSENIKYVEIWKNNTSSSLADRITFKEITVYAVNYGKQPKIDAETLTLTFT